MANTTTEKPLSFDFNTAHRVSYADIIEARAFKKNGVTKGEPRYAATFIINPDDPDLEALKKEVIALLNQNNKSGKKLKVGRLTEEQERAGTHIEVQIPWKSGDREADRLKEKGKDGEVFRGKTLLKASSKFQPALAALDAGKLLEFNTSESIAANGRKYFYSGAYMVPSLGLHFYKGDDDKPDGVSLYLNAVLFAKHGERLGGKSVNATERFKGYIGSVKDEDPTGGAEAEELDDEIPF